MEFPHLHNPFKTYTPVNVPQPNLANSVRLDQCIHDGKLYLSIDDAIDLALENNLDIAVVALQPADREHGCAAHGRGRILAGCPGYFKRDTWWWQCVECGFVR